ncbi:hypothetical protein SELR_17330 [Selenomonas ruminantium subsp. lactilytica TAM6421]|uniref:CD-NTase-associated protein 15 domain-containing protein n=2 Tax=Selenomonas ruminantium TaxID=971 RepID=I0GRQ4_SELRL|nr:hypothetical protein SELR_17330 [Selenomonas ruminantium subsp. lactilytica TAM6421]
MLFELLAKLLPSFNIVISKAQSSLLSIFSVSLLFKIIDWSFDKYLWKNKYLLKILDMHDFSGKWQGMLQSSYNEVMEIPVILEIEQTWRTINCRCEFPNTNSTSVADMVQIDTSDMQSPVLKFTYKNQSRAMSTALQFHVGYNELRLVDGKLKGFYFTNREQPTKGNMLLSKVSE